MKGWLVGSLKLWIESIIQVRRILKRELRIPGTMTEMKIGRINRLAFGVIFVGFLVVVAVFVSCPGVSCSKTGKLLSEHFAKSKETASTVVAATAPLNKTKTSDKNKNAMKAQTEATSRSNSSWKGGGEPVAAADFETDDYRSTDPTPSLKQPPHKLIPNR